MKNDIDRVLKCLIQFASQKKLMKALVRSILLYSIAAELSLFLILSQQCISAGMWESSQLVLRQISGIGPKIATTLAERGQFPVVVFKCTQSHSVGLVTFDDLANATPSMIESVHRSGR